MMRLKHKAIFQYLSFELLYWYFTGLTTGPPVLQCAYPDGFYSGSSHYPGFLTTSISFIPVPSGMLIILLLCTGHFYWSVDSCSSNPVCWHSHVPKFCIGCPPFFWKKEYRARLQGMRVSPFQSVFSIVSLLYTCQASISTKHRRVG